MSTGLFLYKKSPVSYHRFGNGPEILVAFHGFGQTSSDYLYFEDVLSEQFTVIAIDFFYHGQSLWLEQKDFTEYDMKMIVLGIQRQEKLVGKRMSICSFSMGARMARALVRSFPSHIHYFILLSPPTFIFNRFLNFTTNNPLGLLVFRYFVKHNQQLLSWVEKLHALHILNKSVYLFSAKFIGKPWRLQKVYNTWYAQRKLTTNFRKFSALLNEHQIKTVLIASTNDHITPPQKMVRYVQQLKNHQLVMLNEKHELKTPAVKQALASILNS